MACPHISHCELFPMFSLAASLRTWQIRYCEGDFTRCERHKRSCDAQPVPITLLPNGKHLPARPSGATGDGK